MNFAYVNTFEATPFAASSCIVVWIAPGCFGPQGLILQFIPVIHTLKERGEKFFNKRLHKQKYLTQKTLQIYEPSSKSLSVKLCGNSPANNRREHTRKLCRRRYRAQSRLMGRRGGERPKNKAHQQAQAPKQSCNALSPRTSEARGGRQHRESRHVGAKESSEESPWSEGETSCL
ncbi:hypothetical protein V2J09_002823 [Rumex salicifolius]